MIFLLITPPLSFSDSLLIPNMPSFRDSHPALQLVTGIMDYLHYIRFMYLAQALCERFCNASLLFASIDNRTKDARR